MDISSHEVMLNDRVRVEAYRRAIRKVVRPGDVVLDLGTGSGLLACFACRAGAARVYAIECEPIVELGREVVEANGLSGRVTFLRGLSTRLDPPERVDVVVSEILGYFAFDENILEFTLDARERWLKPGGRLLPYFIRAYLAPVSDPALYREHTIWRRRRYGLTLAPMQRYLANNYYREHQIVDTC